MSVSSTSSGGEGPKVFSILIGEWVHADMVGVTQDGDVILEYQECGALQRQVMKADSKFLRLPICVGLLGSDSIDGRKFDKVTVGGTEVDACRCSFEDGVHFRSEASLMRADQVDYPEACTGAPRECGDSYIEADTQWSEQRAYTRSDSEMFVAAPRECYGLEVKSNSHSYTRLDSVLYVAAPVECGGLGVKGSSQYEELNHSAVSESCSGAAAPKKFGVLCVDSYSRKEASKEHAISEFNSYVKAPKQCGDLVVSANSQREAPQDHPRVEFRVDACAADNQDGRLTGFVQTQSVNPPLETQKVCSMLAPEPTGRVGYPGLLRGLEKKRTGLDDVDVSDLMEKFENEVFKNDRTQRSQLVRTGIEEGIVPMRTDDIERKIVEHIK